MSVLTLKRKTLAPGATIGELYGPDGEFLCHTLEDPCRNVKVKGKTAIPAGEFEVIIGWSQKYGRPMPRLLNVPFFEGILIHPGNDAGDSDGCILVGRHDANIQDYVGSFCLIFDTIFPVIRKLTEHGQVTIKIEGGFEAEHWVKSMETASIPAA